MQDRIEIDKDAIFRSDQFLFVDGIIARGGTDMHAAKFISSVGDQLWSGYLLLVSNSLVVQSFWSQWGIYGFCTDSYEGH